MNRKVKAIPAKASRAHGAAGTGEHGFAAKRLQGLAESVAVAPWFARVGRPLTDPEARDIAAYLGALELGDPAVTILYEWPAVARAIHNADWRDTSWRLEEARRLTLYERAIDRSSSLPALLVDLTNVTGRAAEAAGKIAKRLVETGGDDAALVPSAAGAAAQASHHMALAEAAAAPADHAFAATFRLFMAGRWPIGVVGRTFVIF